VSRRSNDPRWRKDGEEVTVAFVEMTAEGSWPAGEDVVPPVRFVTGP
jgi:hypothetical protein